MENLATGTGLPRGAGGLIFNSLKSQERGMNAFWTAPAKLWLTADRTRLVPDGHPDAAFLYCIKGDEKPLDEVMKLGLLHGDGSPMTGSVTVPVTTSGAILADLALAVDPQTFGQLAPSTESVPSAPAPLSALAKAIETGDWSDEALADLTAAHEALQAATGCTITVDTGDNPVIVEGEPEAKEDAMPNGIEHKSLDKPEAPKSDKPSETPASNPPEMPTGGKGGKPEMKGK